MTVGDNDAAKDLWSQIYAEAARQPGAAIMDFDYDPADDDARARAAFVAAGWSGQQVDALLASGAERNAAAPTTSPGINPAAEAFHAALCTDIEDEMARQEMTSQESVARGVEPRAGAFAAKVGVIMTDQSIVTVGAFTYRFCGIVAKAFHRTILLNPFYWQSDDFDEERARQLLCRNRDLVLYWNRIFLSFAMTGTHATVPFEPSDPAQVYLVEQVARAMELFILAHEYGHHHLGHGRDIEADGRSEEFAADQFALRICWPIGKRDRTPIWNPYLASGSGGIIVLRALEIVRAYERELGGKMPAADTHPTPDERIARFDTPALLFPDEFAVLQGFRLASVRVMKTVAAVMDEMRSAMPPDVRDRLTRQHDRMWQDMPQS